MDRELRTLVLSAISLTRDDKAQLLAAMSMYTVMEKEQVLSTLRELHAREQAQLAALSPEKLRTLLDRITHIRRETMTAAEHESAAAEQDQLVAILTAVEHA